MNSVYLLIGGNLGDRKQNLAKAKSFINAELGKITKASSVYETASWGITGQPKFLNQVLFVKTKFSAEKSMQLILSLENRMGRIRKEKNASRIIDIDILFFNNEVINKKDLTIPHPEIQNRRFALIPMNEIASDYIHPVFKVTIKSLLLTSKDKLEVKLLNEL